MFSGDVKSMATVYRDKHLGEKETLEIVRKLDKTEQKFFLAGVAA